ncbi:MAG: cytidine deaminase [Ignavibacteriales bacterium]|nr:Cytidine deaminase [Ignavibacteriaceae bacterium]MBZ0197712.1 cytidine deaminase [Ignavibacteriaceae bacterium]MCZ2141842.1 cytidine deaminase [Ignavibacteriales bacterium]WKZ73887.1 MAG: cytidine deaminase [Ignavibacteriaceae bacterium]
MMNHNELAQKAREAQLGSYSPYSKFRVGAALLTGDGEVVLGSNVENASYGLTICAERTAFVKAVSAGKKKFKAIAVVGDMDDFCTPCGACRQFMAEFCGNDFEIVLINSKNEIKVFSMDELLPHSFGGEQLR